MVTPRRCTGKIFTSRLWSIQGMKVSQTFIVYTFHVRLKTKGKVLPSNEVWSIKSIRQQGKYIIKTKRKFPRQLSYLEIEPTVNNTKLDNKYTLNKFLNHPLWPLPPSYLTRGRRPPWRPGPRSPPSPWPSSSFSPPQGWWCAPPGCWTSSRSSDPRKVLEVTKSCLKRVLLSTCRRLCLREECPRLPSLVEKAPAPDEGPVDIAFVNARIE